MNSWWTENWWAIPAWALGVALLIAISLYARRNQEAGASKAVFWVYPGLNPDPTKRAVSPRAFWLVVIGVLILAIADWIAR
jgi:hypothetical protein